MCAWRYSSSWFIGARNLTPGAIAASETVVYDVAMVADSAPSSSHFFERIVPPADKPVAGWHVSPVVDLVAYHFSWLWILVPLALCGDKHPADYLGLFAFGMTLS